MTNDVVVDERARQVLEEVVPELYETSKPKTLSFWQAMGKVIVFWDATGTGSENARLVRVLYAFIIADIMGGFSGLVIAGLNLTPPDRDFGNSFGAGFLGGFLYACLMFGVLGWAEESEDKEHKKLRDWINKYVCSIGFYGLCASLFGVGLFYNPLTAFTLLSIPIATWLGQALCFKTKSHWDIFRRKDEPIIEISREVVQKRLIDHMKKTVEQAVAEVEGSDSLVEKRLAELKQKLNRAQTIKKHFSDRMRESAGHSIERERYMKNVGDAEEVIALLKNDLDAFLGEQKVALEFFREVETFIPREESRIADDKFEIELMNLRGEAEAARDTSRETMMKALQPIFDTFIPLERAREQLKLHSLSELEGPGSLARLISGAEAVGSEGVEIDSKVRSITSRLRVSQG